MTTPSQPLPSIVTDRYTVEREIGSGGMATVYLARDTKHDREVALKVLRPELGAVLGADRFLSEIKITARLDHPHILTLIDSGAADGLLYYVLPFVRGESLRNLLNRETQLPVEDAITLTKQVGSALDYAHRHDVIHRDIKPENILIHEGEAILTDFGIALAVKEAGGSRLTETGLSLGTPQYMSPEQATGDRTLGPKSDQYSLAAVLYEMLTGEPPISGATSQSIIAKLITEEPTHIRTVRKSVSPNVDAAVAKALSKAPADRFATIGDFLRALATPTDTVASVTPEKKSSTRMIVGAVAAVVLVAAALGTFALKNDGTPKSAPVALRDRTQLTFSGSIIVPAMSRDGKQLAYFTKSCPTEKCTYALTVQDAGSTNAKSILEGISAAYALEWSSDRRNLLFSGTYKGRYGFYLVSALGGTPRFVSSGGASFYADGDSLLVSAGETVPDKDSAFTLKMTGLSGDVGGTLKIPGGGQGVIALSQIPGSKRMLVATRRGAGALWQIIDREGKSSAQVMNACTCGGMAATDAAWMARAGNGDGEAIVRIAIDPQTGQFAAKQDTIYNGRFTGFTVTDDGTRFIVDDGTIEYNATVGTLADMMAKKFDNAQAMKSSSFLTATMSPDGGRVVKAQAIPDGKGSSAMRLSVIQFGSNNEAPVEADGKVLAANWADSVTIAMATQQDKGLRFSTVDIRNGARRNVHEISDSTVNSIVALRNGWAYIPTAGDKLVIVMNGQKREVKKLPWFIVMSGISASLDQSRLMYWGWNEGSQDSTGYVVVPLGGGAPAQVFTTFAERASGAWLSDGSFLARVWETPEAVTLTKLKLPGIEPLGTIPHLSSNFSYSADMKHAALGWRESHADAFMYRVVKQ